MASARYVWKNVLRFGLVTVPVRAYTAAQGSGSGGDISLNQLHRECNSRVQYKKTCPLHGEVSSGEVVSGYEYSKDQYVVIDPAEVDKLRPQAEKAINIEAFVAADAIEPRYFSGSNYYLTPDGQPAAKPYGVLQQVMKETGRHAFATVVMRGRDHVALLRPVENLLMMSFLSFEQEVRPPSMFADEVPAVEATAPELKMAQMLIDSLTEKKLDLGRYRDTYTDRLRQLIEAKVAGEEVIAPPPSVDVPAATINLMEALERSLAQADRREKKPAKLVAPGSAARAKETRKRKSS